MQKKSNTDFLIANISVQSYSSMYVSCFSLGGCFVALSQFVLLYLCTILDTVTQVEIIL